MRNEQGLEHHYFTLASALLKTFMHDKYALLILEGYMMALINSVDSFFYLFDPHARNYAVMPDPKGTAVVMKFTSLTELDKYLCCCSLNEIRICLKLFQCNFMLAAKTV